MPKNVRKVPRLPNGGSHEHATDAPERRRSPSSPNSPLQQLPSLLDVDQLRQQCQNTRSNVIKDKLQTVPEKRVELVHPVAWRESEEADYSTVFSYSSTSRTSAPADLGTFSDVNTVSVDFLRIQDTLSDSQLLISESHDNDGIPMPNSPIDHQESVSMTLELEETTNPPTLVAVDPLDMDSDCFHFSDSSAPGLSIPYPEIIVEETLSLYCDRVQAEYISHMAAWKSK